MYISVLELSTVYGCSQLCFVIRDSIYCGEWHIERCSVCPGEWLSQFQSEEMMHFMVSCDQCGSLHYSPWFHRHTHQVTFDSYSLPGESSKHSMKLGEVITQPEITALAPEMLHVLGWNCHYFITQSDACFPLFRGSKKEKAKSHPRADE